MITKRIVDEDGDEDGDGDGCDEVIGCWRSNLCSSHAFSLSEFLFLIFIVSTINLEHISNKCNSHTLSP